MSQPATTIAPGVIRADESYTQAEFKKRAGLGEHAFKQVRRDGLTIIAVGKKRYIRGVDWLAYLERKCEASNP